MQITNHHHLNSSMQNSDTPIELKQGEVYKAKIKEKLNDSEALISIRGREIKAKFAGGVPEGDRPTVQVTGKQDQLALVKEIVPQGPKGQPKLSSEAKAFASVGLSDTDSPQLRQAVKLIFDKGQPLSKEVVQELKSFFEKAEGNSQTKSDTVKALVNKGLEVTQTHLRSIHEALHGKPLNEVLTSIAKEVNPDFDPSKDPDKELLKQKIVKVPESAAAAVNKAPAKENVIQASVAATQSKTQNELSEIIASVRKLVEKEPDLKKALQKVNDEIITNPKIDREHVKQIEKASSEAEKLQSIGKERLVQALKNAEAQILAKESVPKNNQVNLKVSSELVSLKHLVSEVRTNPNLQKSIEKVQTEIPKNHLIPAEKVAKVEKAINEATALLRQGRITTGKEVLSQALLSVENEVNESRQMPKQQSGELQKQSEVVKQVKEAVQQEPRLQKAVEQVRDQVVNNPKVDREVAQKVERAMREAVQLQQVGQEATGREKLVKALNQAEVELNQAEPRRAATETRPSEAVRQVKEAVQQEPRLQKAVDQVRDQVINNPKVDREVAQKVERAVREAMQLQQVGREGAGRERLVQALNQAEVELSQAESRQPVAETRPSETVRQVKETVQQEPKLQKAVEQVRDQVVNNPKVDREVAQKVERAVREAVQLQQVGRESVGRERLVQALNQAEVELNQAESRKAVAETRPSEAVRQVKETFQQEPKLQKAVEQVRDQIVNNPKVDREVAQKVERAVQEAVQLQQQGRKGAGRERLVQALNQAEVEQGQSESRKSIGETRPSEAVRQVKEAVQQEPKLQKAVELVRDQIVNNPKVDREVAQKVERAVQEAVQLQQQGREGAGRERLVQTLNQVEVELSKAESRKAVVEPRPSEAVRQVKETVQQEPKLQKAVDQVRDQVVNNQKVDREVAQKVERAVREVVQLQQLGQESAGRKKLVQALNRAEVEQSQAESRRTATEMRPSEVVRQVKESVQQEPKLQKAVEQVRDQVVNNPNIDREVTQKVERAVREAVQLQQLRRETAGREKLVQALNQAEVEQSQAESRKAVAETRPSEAVRQVKETVQQEPKLQKAVEQVRDQVVSNPKVDREVAQKVERAVREAVQLQQVGRESAGHERLVKVLNQAEVELSQVESRKAVVEPRPSEAVRQVKETVQQEPKLQKAVDQVRDQVVNNPKVDREVAQKVERAVREAVQLQRVGREVAGRERLVQALNQAEVELSQAESRRVVAETRPSEAVRKVKETVQQVPKLQKAVDPVRDQVVNNPKVDREVAQKVERAVREAVQLQQIGRESAGRERLVQALNQAEVELGQVETRKSVIERPSEIVKQVKETVQQEPKLQKAVEQVRDQVVNNPKIDREVAQKVERAVREAAQLQQIGRESAGREKLAQALNQAEVEQSQAESRRTVAETRPSEVIRQVKETVQQEPKLQKAVDQVRDQVVNNPKVDREVAQKVERAMREAVQLQQQGREGAGRERVVQALNQAEVEQSQAESRQPVVETRPSEVVRQVKEAVQQEPKLQKAVEQVRDQVVNNPKVDREVAQKVEKAAREAVQLQQLGRESAGRERLVQALNQAEVEQSQAESRRTVAETRPSEVIRQVKEAVQQEPKLQKAIDQVRDQVVSNPKVDGKTEQTALKETVKQIREQLQTEPDIKKVLPKVQDQIVNEKRIDPEIAKNIEKAANQANQLDQAGRDRLVKMLHQVEQSLKQTNSGQPETNQPQRQAEQTQSSSNLDQSKVSSVNREENQPAQVKLPSETIKQALKQFQSQANMEEALNLVRKEISSNPNIDLDLVSKVDEAIEHAQQLNEKGREMAARQHMSKELTEMQQTVAKVEPKSANEKAAIDPVNQYDLNEQLQSLSIQSKDILVTKITQKLAEVTNEFRELKKEISRSLDSVKRTIDTYKQSAYPQAKQMLETAISKLDNTILKSDIMLFTDMKTERKLLQASSELAQAKKLLAKGDFSQASKIVGQVKELIDKINFKPSEQKIMHFVGKESMALENKSPLGPLETAARGFTMPEPSARQMFETVRTLGLNHDNDLANSLVFKNGDQPQQEQQQHLNNMKAVLMKLQNEEAGSRVAQQAEQALNNLTGQQLLSKSDSQGTLQSMLFNLPMLLGGDPENIQVYVNSKSEGQQVDWENCNLYFLLETKKLGDVGIMLSSTDRNLSITIKNDKPGLKEKMEPIASLAKERLKDIGYNIGSLHFTRMTPLNTNLEDSQDSQSSEQKPKRPIFTEKGMDFKI